MKGNIKMLEILDVRLLTETAKVPTRNLSTDAGLDLYADQDVLVPAGGTAKISTGIAVNIPKGYVGKIEDRSSMASKGLRTGAGVVDTGFQGNLSVVIHNLNNFNDSKFGMRGYHIKKGDKIAQIVIYQVALPVVNVVNDFPKSERSDKGFGSSGR